MAVNDRVTRPSAAVPWAVAASVMLAAVAPAAAQTGSLRGWVRDVDGAALDVATVRVLLPSGERPLRAAETDRLGFFLVEDLPVGPVEVLATRFGYVDRAVRVEVEAGTIVEVDIELVPRAFELEGVSVDAEMSRERARFEESVGATVRELAGADLKTIPGLAEADPLRAVEVLPGVVSTSDFTSAFNVRGGSADQNLILLDGQPIFNPFHLGGFFSVFNADMVARAELLSGGFPARFGSRVSSVLEVETDPGTGRPEYDVGVSLLATRAAAAGGLPATWTEALGLRTARWRVSGRRSYFDILAKPVLDFPYHLNDLQGIFEAWSLGGSRLTVSAYTGDDVLDLADADLQDFPLRVDWNWGNDVAGLRYTSPRPNGGQFELRTGVSRFSTGLEFPDFDDSEIRSRVSSLSAGASVSGRPVPHWTLEGGVGIDHFRYDNRFASGGTEFAAGSGSGSLASLYLQGIWSAPARWLVEAGTRIETWLPDPGDAIVEVSPRLSAKRFFLGGDVAVKAAVGRYVQYMHSVRDEELPLGIDVWILAGERAPRVASDQVQLGLEITPTPGLFVSLEGYARDFDGVITNNFADDPNDDLDDLLPGDGTAVGADLFVRKSGGATTGWIAISVLRATRRFPDFRSGLDPAPTVEYSPIFDRRLDVDIVLNRSLGWGVDGGLRFNFGTGVPFTRPVASYTYFQPRLTSGARGVWQGVGGDSEAVGLVLGPRNDERYPAYHRLDVSFRRPSVRRWGTLTPYLQILNVYNRKNVLFYFFEYDRPPPVREGISMFPLLPTVGLEISF